MHTLVFGCDVRYVPNAASDVPYVEVWLDLIAMPLVSSNCVGATQQIPFASSFCCTNVNAAASCVGNPVSPR